MGQPYQPQWQPTQYPPQWQHQRCLVPVQPVVVKVQGRRGLGALHLSYAGLTLATCGAALPFWILHAIIGRRR